MRVEQNKAVLYSCSAFLKTLAHKGSECFVWQAFSKRLQPPSGGCVLKRVSTSDRLN